MKQYTDLEQSRALAEILPKETADQTWQRVAIAGSNLDVPEEIQYRHNGDMSFKIYRGIGIPCWSLVALLELFDDKAGLARDYGWWFCYDNGKSHCTKHYENSIDAAFEMVCWMKENKKI